MAPEVLACAKNSNKRTKQGISRNHQYSYKGEKADMFSLGVILFTMYFGMVPFQGDYSKDELFECASSGDLQRAEKFFSDNMFTKSLNERGMIPESLKRLFVKLFNIKPENRPTVSQLLKEDEWLTDANSQLPNKEYQS